MIRTVLVTVTLASACYSPGYKDCEVACGAGDCPSGLTCDPQLHVCRLAGMNGPCGVVNGDGPGSNNGDAPGDGTPATGWTTPVQLTNTTIAYSSPTLNGAMTEMYFAFSGDIYRKTRPTTMDAWGPAAPVPALSDSTIQDSGPTVNAAALELYFVRVVNNRRQIFRSVRPTGADWTSGTLVQELDINTDPAEPSLGVQNTALVWELPTTQPLWGSAFNSTVGTWSSPQPFPVSVDAHAPAIISNGDLFFHGSVETNGVVHMDLFVMHVNMSGTYDPPVALAALNTTGNERDPWVSQDGQTIIFVRDDLQGNTQIWTAQRMP